MPRRLMRLRQKCGEFLRQMILNFGVVAFCSYFHIKLPVLYSKVKTAGFCLFPSQNYSIRNGVHCSLKWIVALLHEEHTQNWFWVWGGFGYALRVKSLACDPKMLQTSATSCFEGKCLRYLIWPSENFTC